MIQLLLFGIALCTSAYGALNGSLISLLIATLMTLLGAVSLYSNPSRQARAQQAIAGNFAVNSWLIVSVVAVFLASLATRRALDNAFDFTSGYFWLAGMVLVTLAAYGHDFYERRRLATSVAPPQAAGQHARFDWLDWLSIALITAVALGLRLYKLTDFLPTMHGDEGEMGMLALLALHGPASGVSPMPLPLFSTAFLDHPTLFHYLQAGALWLFGESLYGLRALSALFGALCVPVVYAIGRLGWGRIAGVTAGWLLAVSHFHLQYSRIALNNVETIWFLALFIFLFLLAAAKTAPRPRKTQGASAENVGQPQCAPLAPYLWIGLCMGLSQYFYYGSRLLPVLAGLLLLVLWLKRRLTMAQVIILAVATFVAYAPLAGHYSKSLPAFLNRTKGVSVISPEGMAHTLGPQAVWPDDIPQLIWEQVRRNVAFFAYDGDRSAFYMTDLGGFDPITIALFWLGLGVLLARIGRFEELTVFLWWGVGLFLAGVVTNDAPNGPRLVVITTSVYIIGGIFLQRAFNFVQSVWPVGSQWGALAGALLLTALTFQLNFTTYFETYAQYTPNTLAIRMAHEIRDWGPGYKVYLFGAPNLYADYSTLRFIAAGIERYNADLVDQLPAPESLQAEGRGLLAIFLPHRLPDLEQVMARFPNGVRGEQSNAIGNLLYVTYRIPSSTAFNNPVETSKATNHTTLLSSPLPTPAAHP